MDPKKNLKRVIKKVAYETDPSKAVHTELTDQTDILESINENLVKSTPEKERVKGVADFVTGFLDSVKGEKGDTGATGPQGEKGDKGDTGEMGPEGPAGIDGKDGEDGKDGMDGKPGEIGPVGPKGDKGETGPAGKDATPEQVVDILKKKRTLDISHIRNGEQLARAAAKLQTIDFDDERWHGSGSGHTIQDAGTSLPQEKYLNFTGPGVSTADSPTTNSTIVTISGGGGAGSTGPTGYTGYTGYTGSQGATGYTGYTGDTGAASTVTGPTGYTGYTGYTGAASTVTGPTGYTGAIGPTGPDSGATGYTGYTGYTGPTGYTGYTGPQGNPGVSGISGAKVQPFTTTTTINVTHNFNAYPVVQVIDDSETLLIPLSVVHNTTNDLTVTLAVATSGNVICSIGGVATSVVTTAISYSILDEDNLILANASSPITITLPATTGIQGKTYNIKHIGTNGVAVTVDTTGGATIDDSLTQIILAKWTTLTVFTDGTNWFII